GVNPIGGVGTTNDTVLARLSFEVIGASGSACTAADLVAFQADAGPFQTKLSDEFGQPVIAETVALPAISIDDTPPVITCAPVVVSNDPGLCSATIVAGGLALHETFDVQPDLGAWVSDRYA